MASQGVEANSRLAQMQMRFQQKQLQERELRRIEMTGGKSGTSETTTAAAKNIGNGKVRQMFDERRRGAGIDRSHPLKPITTSKTSASTSDLSASMPARRTTQATTIVKSKVVNSRRTINAFEPSISNGNMTRNRRNSNSNSNSIDELDYQNNEIISKQLTSLSLSGDSRIGDRNNNNELKARIGSSNSMKLNPVVTKKSPTVASTARVPAVRLAATTPPGSATKSRTTRVTPPVKTVVSVKSSPKSSAVGKTVPVYRMSVKGPPTDTTPAAGMATCRFCKRHFNEDRLAKHEAVCQKMANSKRKIFDASKHRVQGTEAEKYVRKPPRSNVGSSVRAQGSNYITSAGPGSSGLKKSNWRKKHEEFINAIRAAKQVQAHLARGGKLSDLPPPPPSENPDYVQCPHCMRRFNETAAERHIPRCANMIHNKPKPGAVAAKKR